MVDVREIYERVRESSTISDITRRFMSLKSAQAVTVRVLPWLLVDPDAYHYMRHFPYPWDGREFSRLPPFFWERWWGPEDHAAMPKRRSLTMVDIDKRFGNYPPFPGYGSGHKYPFQVILHVDQTRFSDDELETIGSMTEDERVLVTAEWRPPMRLQFAAGDQVLSGKSTGTIGGFISEGNNTFGLTCSHVVTGNTVTDLGGQQIGKVARQASPHKMAIGSVCTPYPPNGAIGAFVNNNDFALVNVSVAVQPSGYAASPAPSLQQTDLIDVNCQKGSLRFTVRSLCIAMNISHGGNSYCFAPLVELYSLSGTTQRGDSGSWGIKGGTDWATMIAGADSISSFAFDARDVAQWIDGCGSVTPGAWSVY